MASAAVLKLAVPAVRPPDPSTVVPSLKMTVPVGMPPVELTKAVKVTDCPAALGSAEEIKQDTAYEKVEK